MKHIFIMNPNATYAADVYEFRNNIKTIFTNIAKEYYVFVTEYAGHAQKLAKTLCGFFRENKVRFYACGGGGTLFEVLNGIQDFKSVEVALLPMGKNNDILQAVDQGQITYDDLLGLVTHGKPERLDMMCINDKTYALNNICFGHDKSIGRYAHKNHLGIMQTLGPSLENIAFLFKHLKYQHIHEYTVTIDGVHMHRKCNLAMLMNGVCYERRHICDSSHSMYNGSINAVFLSNESILGFSKNPHDYGLGEEGATTTHTCVQGSHIEVSRTDKMPLALNVDGESMTVNTLSVKVVPNSISFVKL